MRRPAAVLTLVATLSLLGASCGDDDADDTGDGQSGAAVLVSSEAFEDGAEIPVRYTCEGEDLSPPLHWDGIPDDAVSVDVVVDDPDAPGGTFVHWVVSGLDPSISHLEEGEVPPGARQPTPYRGPCPPEGDDPHQYRFRVLVFGADRDAGPVATGVLTGRFGR